MLQEAHFFGVPTRALRGSACMRNSLRDAQRREKKNVVYTEVLPSLKKKDLLPLATTWVNLEDIMQNKTDLERQIHMISLT